MLESSEELERSKGFVAGAHWVEANILGAESESLGSEG